MYTNTEYFCIVMVVYKSLLILVEKLKYKGLVKWLTPVIWALWDAKAGRSQSQEIKTILAKMEKPPVY